MVDGSPGTLAGRRGDLLVYLATTRYDGPAGTDRHMADQLSELGPVLFVDPPVSPVSLLRERGLDGPAQGPALRVLSERHAVLTPLVVPGLTRPGLHRLVPPMIGWAVRRALRQLHPSERGSAPVRGIISCRIDDVWSRVPAARRVHYATDDVIAGAELLGLPRKRLNRQVARTLRDADEVAAVSQPLLDRFAAQGRAATLVPNGCDPEAYDAVDVTAPAPDVRLTGPVAGFIGYVNDRIDLALLEAVADSGISLLLVGPRAPNFQTDRFDALVARPGVQWVGPKPFSELPAYLRVIDVGLTPYAGTPFNRASFPLKTLEYLAAGRRVVATPLPAHAWLDTDLVDIAGTPAAFAERTAAATRTAVSAEERRRRRDFARGHSWAHRASALAALVDRGVADAGERPAV